MYRQLQARNKGRGARRTRHGAASRARFPSALSSEGRSADKYELSGYQYGHVAEVLVAPDVKQPASEVGRQPAYVAKPQVERPNVEREMEGVHIMTGPSCGSKSVVSGRVDQHHRKCRNQLQQLPCRRSRRFAASRSRAPASRAGRRLAQLRDAVLDPRRQWSARRSRAPAWAGQVRNRSPYRAASFNRDGRAECPAREQRANHRDHLRLRGRFSQNGRGSTTSQLSKRQRSKPIRSRRT